MPLFGSPKLVQNSSKKYVLWFRFWTNFKSVLGKYFFQFIKKIFKNIFENQTNKSTVDSLRLPAIQNFMFCTPPIFEQRQIIKYLDKKIQKIDRLIEKENKRIILLKEHSKSLISEVVTGKIDVRDEVIA